MLSKLKVLWILAANKIITFDNRVIEGVALLIICVLMFIIVGVSYK